MNTPETPDTPKDFESAMRALEQLVDDLESGKLTLDQSIEAYKRGRVLSAFCEEKLENARLQVQILENGEFKEFDAGKRNA